MKKPPYFPFYPGDFLSDFKVASMNMEERGAYITLLSHDWRETGIPNDPDLLKSICGNPENWPTIWAKVRQCFYRKNDRLFNKRLEKERKKYYAWIRKSREGGIKSGISRRKPIEPPFNHPSNHPSTTLEPPYEPNGKQSYSYLNTNKKKEKEPEEKERKDPPNYKYSEGDLRLTNLFIERILENNPRAKVRNITELQKESWANQCRLLREAGWSLDEIETVIEYTQQDEFEIPNVQSMGKLRERIDNLSMKARREIAKSGERDVGRQRGN